MTPPKHRRKLFWPLGLISLIGLPIMFFVYLINDKTQINVQTMEINLPPINYREIMSRWNDFDVPPNGKWNVIQFTSDENVNTNIFEWVKHDVQRLNLHQDTERGVEIRLDPNMPYNRFVKILDLLNTENVVRYSIINSSIWVHRIPRRKYPKRIDDSPFVCGNAFYEPPPPSCSERIDFMKAEWKLLWQEEIARIPLPITLTWSALLILNFVRINKWYNINKVHRITYNKS